MRKLMCSTVDCYDFELIYCCGPEGFRHRKLSSRLMVSLLFSFLTLSNPAFSVVRQAGGGGGGGGGSEARMPEMKFNINQLK